MSTSRVAGTAYLKMGAEQLPLGGSLSVSPNNKTREAVAGLSGVVGHKETPRAPYVEGEVVLSADVSLKTLEDYTGGTIVVELANGSVYTLHDAFFAGDLEADAAEGMVPVRFEGTRMDEKQ